ncbi:MAG: hypothetical protein HC888_08155 [Candidatus Competibacteraceae bacterium]|nr:hypothetical protein [Candidatus Competibacteraceae bacterium]
MARLWAFSYIHKRQADPAAIVARANAAMALLFFFAFLAGSALEHSLVLPGPAVGLLEHPAIYLFLVGQVLFPWALIRAVYTFQDIPRSAAAIVISSYLSRDFDEHCQRLQAALRLDTNRSKVAYAALVGVGISAFAWNSLQNQAPHRWVGIDFWDSINYPIGFYLTRIYKLYHWVFLIPACVHIMTSVVMAIRELLHDLSAKQAVKLDPFHADQCGGTSVFVDAVLTPMIFVTLLASMNAAAAVYIHQKADISTLGGISMAGVMLAIVYLIPTTALQKVIKAEKARTLNEIGTIQSSQFKMAMITGANPRSIAAAAEVISALSLIASHVRSLPNWPRFRRMAGLTAALALCPMLGWLGGLISPYLIHFAR